MNCDEARQHWDLYHDSEGDASLHLAIGEHLARCPSCAEWFTRQSLFETLLEQKLRAQPATPELWRAVLAQSDVVRPVHVPRTLLLAGLALAALFLVAVTIVLNRPAVSASGDHLSALSASWHARLSEGEEQAPFQSDSDQDVEHYLRSRVNFPVRCPPRKDAGFQVQGAGLGSLGSEQVAFLLGRVDGAPVSIFILSRDSLSSFPHEQAALRSGQIHRCREGHVEMALSLIDENLVLVAGEITPDRLERVINAYGTYPHNPAS